MFLRLTFISILIVVSYYLNAQINILSDKDSLTSINQKELKVPPGELIIIYPMVKPFSSDLLAIVDYSNRKKFGNPNSYVTEIIEKQKRSKAKSKVKKMTFKSEADILNYFLKEGYSYIGGESTSFILKKNYL